MQFHQLLILLGFLTISFMLLIDLLDRILIYFCRFVWMVLASKVSILLVIIIATILLLGFWHLKLLILIIYLIINWNSFGRSLIWNIRIWYIRRWSIWAIIRLLHLFHLLNWLITWWIIFLVWLTLLFITSLQVFVRWLWNLRWIIVIILVEIGFIRVWNSLLAWFHSWHRILHIRIIFSYNFNTWRLLWKHCLIICLCVLFIRSTSSWSSIIICLLWFKSILKCLLIIRIKFCLDWYPSISWWSFYPSFLHLLYHLLLFSLFHLKIGTYLLAFWVLTHI